MAMMGKSWSGMLILVLVMVVMGVYEVNMVKVAAVVSPTPSQCKEELRPLVGACKPIIFGFNPSTKCCQQVRVVHFECVCPAITPKIASFINVKRTVKQIEACGRIVPHQFKCGSITTP